MPRKLAGLVLACSLTSLACGEADLDLGEVRRLHEQQRYEETIDPLREALVKDPDRREASLLLGSALAQGKRYGEAMFHLRRAARDGEFAGDAGLLLAGTFLKMENFDAAIGAADDLLSRNPTLRMGWLIRAQAALLAAKPDVALESADRALALEPDDFPSQLVRAGALMALERSDEAERAFADVFARAPQVGPEAVASACTDYARFQLTYLQDADAARSTVDSCADVLIQQPLWVRAGARLYMFTGNPESAMALARRALEASPENHAVRILVAEELSQQGRHDAAEAELLAGTELPNATPLWVDLAQLRRETGDPAGAIEAIDRAIAIGEGDSEASRFFRADTLIDLDRLSDARADAGQLEEPVYRNIVEGRIALESGDSRRALTLFDSTLQQWPDHAGVRILAARAAYELGDEERALSDLLEATRAAPTETDASLLLARLHLLRGENEEAYAFVLRHLGHRGGSNPSVLRVGSQAARATGDLPGARAALESLAQLPGHAALGWSELAQLEAETDGIDAARAVVAESGLDLADPENETLLRRAVRLEIDDGKPRSALRTLDAVLAETPQHTAAHAIRAHVLLEGGDREGAAAGFEDALSLDPESAEALAGLGSVALQAGNSEDAVARFEQAAALSPDEPAFRYGLAQALLTGGANDAAEKLLREIVRTHPEHASAANDLAWLLALRGEDLERAGRLAERAVRLASSPEALDTLGFVQLRSGEVDAAREAFQKALDARPGYSTARYHLALTHLERSDEASARRELVRALDGEPFAEAEDARKALANLGE